MADVIYNSFKRDVANGSIDLDTDSIKIMLVTSAYAADQDLHTKRSDITNEVVGTGYAAGGVALTTKTMTADNTGNRGIFDADDVSWAASTITARGAVAYKSRGGAASADELLFFLDFVTDKTSSGGTFLIAWNATGIATLT